MSKDEDELRELEEELKELVEGEGEGKTDYGSPEPEKKESMYKFFREIINLKESWKVGNLKDEEIGQIRLGVRSYLDLARYAQAENLDLVKDYFIDKADIVAAPTMGRKGFMAQLFVTQIRKEQKIKDPSALKKKGWFGKKTNEQDE